jgi:hypothetical protein
MDRLSFRSKADAAGFTLLSNLVLLDTALTDGAKVTYLVLLHHARQAGSCFPGQERLSVERGVTERSVRSHLKELVERGLITIERRGQARTNLYWLESLEAVYRKKTSAQEYDRKNLSGPERKFSSGPNITLEEDSYKEESATFNVAERPGDKSRFPDIERLVRLTGDTRSVRRFVQLYDIAMKNRCMALWDEAVTSLKRRLENTTEPLVRPGAYFCATLAALLGERGVYVPVGSKTEREEIRSALRESLGLQDVPSHLVDGSGE